MMRKMSKLILHLKWNKQKKAKKDDRSKCINNDEIMHEMSKWNAYASKLQAGIKAKKDDMNSEIQRDISILVNFSFFHSVAFRMNEKQKIA